MSGNMFFQHLFNAVTLGSLYGLIAIGYTMVYGILRLINFAHGEVFMLGRLLYLLRDHPVEAPVGSCRRSGGRSASSCLRHPGGQNSLQASQERSRISALISAIGVSFFIQNLSIVIFTGLPRPVSRPDWLVKVFKIGEIRMFSPLPLLSPP